MAAAAKHQRNFQGHPLYYYQCDVDCTFTTNIQTKDFHLDINAFLPYLYIIIVHHYQFVIRSVYYILWAGTETSVTHINALS